MAQAIPKFNAPRFYPPRYVDGDIYGFAVMLNNDPNGTDSNFPVFPQWSDGEASNGGLTGGHNTRSNTNGQIVGIGAVGSSKDNPNPSASDWIESPFEAQDIMDEKQSLVNATNTPAQPIWYEYSWYDPTENLVKNSNNYTLSAAFHECYYITIGGKLRNMGTRYNTKPAIANAFNNIPPALSLGYDWRMQELWQEDPTKFGYNPDITLKHISVAANECIMTLDTNGTIRIVQAGTSGVELTTLMGETDYHMVVYFNKEDLEDNFWIDEFGNTVEMQNVDFVDCWTSGGGVNSQGICVWALKADGTLYYQDMHNMVWWDKDYWKRDDFNGGMDGAGRFGGEQVQGQVRAQKGKYRSEPFRIQKLSSEPGEEEPSDTGTWMPQGEPVINPYHGAKIDSSETDLSGEGVRDLNDYLSTRQTRRVSAEHQRGIEEYLDFSVSAIDDPIYGDSSLHKGWVYEAGRNALNQIPVNSNNKRFKVTSLFDGYGHGCGCVCVDPDEPIGNPYFNPHPNQMVEPVLLTSWSPGIHKHMYEQLHKVKRYRVVKNGLDWITESNIIDSPDEYGYSFDSELFDLLYKDRRRGSTQYIPPRRISSTRRNFVIMSNTGMVASFQGAGKLNNEGTIDPPGDGSDEYVAPLVNYKISESNSNQIELLLDVNGKAVNQEYGNWFYNYDWSAVGDYGDPVDPILPAIFAPVGAFSKWYVNAIIIDGDPPPIGTASDGESFPSPSRGPHQISTDALSRAQNAGRFGFGNMPMRSDGTTPGIYDKPFTLISDFTDAAINGESWAVSYFAWTEEMGYDYEKNYWNQDSLVYMWSGKDVLGQTIYSHPDDFIKGSSIIQVWHAGEGSNVEPFATDPVIWWSGQGDNLTAIFKSGKIDSCSYYVSEMSACVLPPLSLPAININAPTRIIAGVSYVNKR